MPLSSAVYTWLIFNLTFVNSLIIDLTFKKLFFFGMALFAPNVGVDITIALTLNLLTVLGTIANVMVLVKVRQSVGSRHHYGVSQVAI